MPRLAKKNRAAKLREAKKKLIRETTKALLNMSNQSAGQGVWSSQLVLKPPDQSSASLEPNITMQIKEEPLDLEVNPFEPGHLEEIKVELVEPTEGETDPIGSLLSAPTESKVELEPKKRKSKVIKEDSCDTRCQFCLKLLTESGGRGPIRRNKIVFVLGARKWGSPRERPNCCKNCKRMFDLFYNFKRSCLTALARPEFLLASIEKNIPNKMNSILSVSTKKVNQRHRKTQQQLKLPQPIKEEETYQTVEITETKPPSEVSPSSDEESDIEIVNIVETLPAADLNADSMMGHLVSDETNLSDNADTKQLNKKKNKERKYCFRCKQFFANEIIYDEHKPSCTKPPRDPPPLACPECPKRFNREDKLNLHINKHNGVRTVPCRREGCTKMFFSTNYRHSHEMLCGQDVQIICSVCAAIFRSKGALNAHMATHGDPKFACDKCDKAFHTKWELETHLLTHDSTPVNKRRKSSDDSYNDTIEAQQPSNDAPEESNPETTEHSAADDKALPNLIPAPTAPKRKYCFRCKKFYESEAIYMEHRPTCTKPPRDPPPLACNQCPKRFNRQEHLTYHINQHNGIRTVPCRREGCTKMFFQPQVRQRHELTCGKEPELMCTKCASVFRSKSALSAHMATHGDPTFFCEKCTRGFYSKANLQKHYASHSDARNFECKTCGKRFKSHEANRVHQRIHTQEKPYVCPDCGMAFMYNCVLKTHQDKGQCAGPAAGLKDSFHQAAEDE